MSSRDLLVKQVSANYIFKNRKVFNDPIHGQIEIHPVCVRIIDTPQFQRLRHIKQLDACSLVYPGACHTRFEHSIGTCYLAEKLMRTLQQRQPSENIDERDILCVVIAALCHDLGQGPFSHIFEKRFMPEMNKEFTHEETAKLMFEYILEDNDNMVLKDIQNIILECSIPHFDEFREEDFLFIKEMIGKPKDIDAEVWPYEGRDESKSFMYEIVANKRNGIDVDKWDYLLRDSYMLGMKVNFQHERCFMSAKVLKANGNCTDDTDGNTESDDSARRPAVSRKQICYREKDAFNLYDMFYTRMTLHRKAYQHKTHRIIGKMICEALKKANDTVRFCGKNRSFSIADAVDDMEAFTQLTDDILQIILYSPADSKVLLTSDLGEINTTDFLQPSSESNFGKEESENFKKRNFVEAKHMISDILNRRLFKIVTETQMKMNVVCKREAGPAKEKEQEIIFDEKVFEEKFLKKISVEENTDIFYDVVDLDYGMKNKNPMENVRFYKKKSDERPIKIERNQVSFVLPDTFAEKIVRIYVRNLQHGIQDALFSRIQGKFSDWCRENKLPLPKGSSQTNQNTIPKHPLTPERNSDTTNSDSDQRSGDEDLENKRLVEPNTIQPNEEHQDTQSLSAIGGVDIRLPDSVVSEDKSCS